MSDKSPPAAQKGSNAARAGLDVAAGTASPSRSTPVRVHKIELGVPPTSRGEVGEVRLAGFRAVMTAAGLDPDAYRDTGGMSEVSGFGAAPALAVERPTAVFAFDANATIGVPQRRPRR